MTNDQIAFRAIILAGGKGSRLGKITKKIPKPLIKIKNREFLSYLIEFLKINHVKEIIITTSYKSKLFDEFCKKNKYKNIKIIKEKKELGTGGSFLNVLKKTRYKKNYFNILCNADTLVLFSLNSLKKEIIKNKNSILVIKKRNCERYGRIKIKGKNIIGIERNNSNSGYISTGVFFFKKVNLNHLKMISKKIDFERDVLKRMIEKRVKIKYIKTRKPFIDIGVPKDLKRSKKFIENRFNESIKKL